LNVRRLLPKSLLGQMLLSVALALLVAQGISAFLLYRAQEQRREMGAANALVFWLVAEPRFDFRQNMRNNPNGAQSWRRLRVERTPHNPLRPGEKHDTAREAMVRSVLADQGITPAELVVTVRKSAADLFVQGRLRERPDLRNRPEWTRGEVIVAGLRRQGATDWTVARLPVGTREPSQLGPVIGQTVLLYILLVGGLAVLLRRITRPLNALTRRVETIGTRNTPDAPLEPSGPEDTRRLIAAHNAMEARIAALLDEKDVMLGAIGHDLKTPLAALRVRLESVEDPAEREKMVRNIEDITRSLDDILSLARVGRPSDPMERTDLSALVASVVEEYEDMGEPVTLGDTQRLSLALRATWLRRGIRNLVGNALRYGKTARVSLVSEGREAVIRIEDEGPGIPPNEIDSMLEPFTRGEASRNRHTGGAGLGLTLARAIAEQHGGRLVLANRRPSSPHGGGLVAELRLPLD
jgi:signal transduction histidine kinase